MLAHQHIVGKLNHRAALRRRVSALLTMLLMSSICFAGPEISGGTVHYQQTPNGTWYQIGYPHNFNPPPRVWSVGYSDYYAPGVRYHWGFVSLGGVINESQDVSDASFTSGGMNGCTVNCGTMWRFSGSSKLTALYYTLAPEKQVGDFRLFAEAGPVLYHLTFREQSYQVSGPGAGTSTEYTFSGFRPGVVLGAGMQYGQVQLVLSTYVNRFTGVGNAPPNFGYLITTAAMRYIWM